MSLETSVQSSSDKDTQAASDTALCVDLDGTLVHTDLLVEALLALLRRNPLYFLAVIWWMRRGRAHVKRQIAQRVTLDYATLPYNDPLLQWLRQQRGTRTLVLATAADSGFANAIDRHLGLFDVVMASDGHTNLGGQHKAHALVERFGEGRFDYAGNARGDLSVWRCARKAVVVGGRALRDAANEVATVDRQFETPARWSAAVRALRPHQWLKNVLVFLPLLAAHLLTQPTIAMRSLAAFVVFCACASTAYLLNDLLDLAVDRRHPRKRQRPFASGQLPVAWGLIATPLLTIGVFGAAVFLSPTFALVLLGYFLLTTLYSLRLKQIAILDVIILASLYTTRIIAGTVAIATGFSFWLLAFSMFLFLSLAVIKRYTELGLRHEAGMAHLPGRGYAIEDRVLLAAMGSASGYMSVLVLALYINSPASVRMYNHPQLLWLLCPLLLYWISRAWLVAHRGAMHDDPVLFAITDRVSHLIVLLVILILFAASF